LCVFYVHVSFIGRLKILKIKDSFSIIIWFGCLF
jgi:hypothetical protein